MKYKTTHNVVYSCRYHVVWCPKYRRKVLIDDVARRLKELILSICNELKVDIIQLEIMPDNIYLLIEVDPQYGIYKTVKTIKSNTAHILRCEFKHLTTKLPSLWTNSYFVSTVDETPYDIIKQYIECQTKSQREEGKNIKKLLPFNSNPSALL